MKRIISVLLALIMIFCMIPVSFAYTCEDGKHHVEVWFHNEGKNTHTGTCQICGREVTESCYGDPKANCKTSGTCTACAGSYYGDHFINITTVSQAEDNFHKGICQYCENEIFEHCYGDPEATCQDAGICAACKAEYNAEHDFTSGPVWNHDEIYHWHYCRTDKCDEIKDKQPHKFITKYDGANGHYKVCEECGYQTNTEKHMFAQECSPKCKFCDYTRTNVVHKFSSTYIQTNNKHCKVCTVCGTQSAWEDCSGGKATCAESAICSKCGNHYGNKLSTHTPNSNYNYNETSHWVSCQYCDYIFPATNHTFSDWEVSGNNQVRHCTICGKEESHVLTKLTVQFDTLGHGTIPEKQIVLHGNKATNPGNPSASIDDGFSFDGWWRTKEYNRKFDFSEPIQENTTIYAKWKESEYNIIYKLSDGSTFDGNHEDGAPKSYVYGKGATIKGAEKDGYKFEGWYDSNSFKNRVTEISTTQKGDVTLYAKLTANTYTVNFNKNADDATGVMNPQHFEYDETTRLTANSFVRTGYHFASWNKQSDGKGTSYLDKSYVSKLTTVDNGSVNLFAQWNGNKYDIIYKDEGDIAFSGDSSKCPKTHTYGKDTVLVAPTKVGFDCVGLYIDKECSTEIKTLEGNKYLDKITLYVKWEPQTHKIIYLANGGEGNMTDQEFKCGETVVLFQNTYTKKDYAFLGWSTKPDAKSYTDVVYVDKQEIKEIASNTDVDLYAVWGKVNNVTLKADGGIIEKGHNVTEYTEGVKTKLPSKEFIKKVGYTFLGWVDDSDEKIYFEIPQSAIGPKSYTAKWAITNHKISVAVTTGTNYGSAKYKVNNNSEVKVSPSANVDNLTQADTVIVTATPNSGYYARIYTGTENNYKTLATSEKGKAVSYTLKAEDINSNIDIKIQFTQNPPTGDEFNPILWVLALSAGAAGAAVTLIAKKKRTQH